MQRPRNSRFKPIGVALQKPAKSIGGKRGFHDQTLLKHWSEFAGKDLSRMCKPREIKARRNGGSVLVVECLSAHASELSMRSEELRTRLNMCLGFEAIGKISIHHQHIGFANKTKAEPTEQKLTPKPLPQKLSQDLANTTNSDLREALQRFSETFYNKGAKHDLD